MDEENGQVLRSPRTATSTKRQTGPQI